MDEQTLCCLSSKSVSLNLFLLWLYFLFKNIICFFNIRFIFMQLFVVMRVWINLHLSVICTKFLAHLPLLDKFQSMLIIICTTQVLKITKETIIIVYIISRLNRLILDVFKKLVISLSLNLIFYSKYSFQYA